MIRTVGVILAGGLSRRFGSPKAFAKLGIGIFMNLLIEALKAQCERVIIVARPEHCWSVFPLL